MHERITARRDWDPTVAQLRAERERLVESARVRGFMIEDALDVVRASAAPGAPARGAYRAFASYPARDYFDAIVWAADVAYATLPLREGVRRVARSGFLAVAKTIPGKIVFGSVARDIAHAVRLIATGYELAGSSVRATVLDLGDGHVQMRLTPVLALADSAVAGGFEGLFEAYACTGTVGVTREDDDAVLVDLRWQRTTHAARRGEQP